MHFPTFAVGSTNIFPLSNSTKGGQLVTEYNLRAREMVSTDPEIEYEVGPSYTHNEKDFEISLLSSMEADDYSSKKTYSLGQYVVYNSVTYVCIEPVVKPEPFDQSKWLVVNASSAILQIAPGRAVINGHYVQTLAPMIVDLTLANAQLAKNYEEPLLGELTIGIRAYYSTESTMAGAMLIENEDNTYTGIQLVIEKKANFILPIDSPSDRSKVTADLKLADFVYISGVVTNIVQNKYKMSYINSSRIDDMTKVLDTNFISKKNLNPDKLYTFSGQGSDSRKSTWCDSTGSLMVWDASPKIISEDPNTVIPQATFLTTADGFVHLAVPHQQVDSMKNTAGEDVFYAIRDLKLPKANYVSGSSGTVDSEYTNVIKGLADKLGSLKQSPAGSMVLWLDRKDEDYVLPIIPESYSDGDYVFVREDYTANTSEDEGASPSTMYKVLPGYVTEVALSEDGEGKPKLPTGLRLGETAVMWEGDILDPRDRDVNITEEALKHLADFYDETRSYQPGEYAAYYDALYICAEATSHAWEPSAWSQVIAYNALSLFSYNTYRGSKAESHTDYFEVSFHNSDDTGITSYYYKVKNTGARSWSDYILVTGGIPLANVDQAGGFYNTDPSATDGGYVTLDESGRLKLIDYELLRSGALAYQLGADYTSESGITASALQEELDEYVNARVAFPFTLLSKAKADEEGNTPSLSVEPSVIHVKISLSKEEATETGPNIVNIYNIDSRFGTAVELHILGDADNNTIINIVDCQKIRIASNISGTPIINVIRSCIYYDPTVFTYIRLCDVAGIRESAFTGLQDITLWYNRFEDTDPDLQINGMEVSQPNAPMTIDEIAFWNDENPNDNHYSSALKSITFSGNGNIIGCSMWVACNSTATNIVDGRSIIGGVYNMPQGSELMYPEVCLVNPLIVTGSFTTAYQVENDEWVVIATNFSILTGKYDGNSGKVNSGTIAFDAITDLLSPGQVAVSSEILDSWRAGTYHVFNGGINLSNT